MHITARLTNILLTTLTLAVVLALAGCRTQKAAERQGAEGIDAQAEVAFVSRVKAANERTPQCITSKIKVHLQVAGQDLSLTGSLRMKRGEVVRLQLVALGLVEAARIELTPTHLLVMDRINRQYVKVAYKDVDFLRQSGINYSSLEALFWDELFRPGSDRLTEADLAEYHAYPSGTDMAMMMEKGLLTYRWMANANDAQIKTANVTYRDTKRGNTQLTWHYGQFEPVEGGTFPTQNSITIATPRRSVKLDFTLGSISHDDNWETTTTPSSRYKEVSIDDILSKIGQL